ncbi:hypothetical protein BD311DRAFT_755531 [Dichomitus squalens]|uniref:Uncharacterized protein n=1 Tax=Dichomitus squalens TaxID=114155 RepID=A0A4V2K0S1_9APHY|nr:hypothetical protein BD311DRAFT_755531 [Dichomitus squalens]
MGYWGPMGYGVEFPLSRLGKAKILWVFGVYGLPGVWVRRVSTVACTTRPQAHSLVNTRKLCLPTQALNDDGQLAIRLRDPEMPMHR